MRILVSALILIATPCWAGQSAPAAPGNLGPLVPMPDTRGGDVDMICSAAVADSADEARKTGKSQDGWLIAAGYYSGKVIQRREQDPKGFRAAVEQLKNTAYRKDERGAFAKPCLQRFAIAFESMRSDFASAHAN